MQIKILNPIYMKLEREIIPILKPLLSFEAIYYKQIGFKRERKTYPKSFIEKDGTTLTGFLPLIKDYLTEKNIQFDVLDPSSPIIPNLQIPKPLVLRPDQINILELCLKSNRGIIKSPTGSGKTILATVLINSFKLKTLFLCHTLTLIEQTKKEFIKYGLKPTVYSGENKELSDLTIGTIQSISKVNPEELIDYKMIIVDESHHLSSLNTLYGKTLRLIPAPVRFGFTATIPKDKEHKLTMIGLMGPVFDALPMADGIERGILAKPKIEIIEAPYVHEVKELRNYQDVYQYGVVRNLGKNRLIIKRCIELAQENKTSLILVNKIEHGEILERLGRHLNLNCVFIQGSSDGEAREEVRRAFQEKEISTVIATTIWKEGINVPSLSAVINAAGGKSEIATLQSLGRGLRTTEDKKEVLLIDFFDRSHHYLISHFGERLLIFIREKWI